jgi:hypothetical protein
MKIEIEIKLKNDKLAMFDVLDYLTVFIDKDYVDDIEDVYNQIENYIWETFGKSLYNGVDFEIDDENQEIINELFN